MSTQPTLQPNSSVSANLSDFAHDVQIGLTRTSQKKLSATYFYDDLGSALFEAITHLPEYGLTRADERILRSHASDIVSVAPLSSAPGRPIVAELGSGTGRKTRHLLRAMVSQQTVTYYPIDVSAAALAACKQELSAVANVIPLAGTYLEGLEDLSRRRYAGQPLLLLFLGSTIGNFDPEAVVTFLKQVRFLLREGDSMLLGTDLVKPVRQLLSAYDDPVGVTSAFNKNILARINRDLGGTFRLDTFRHQALYEETHRRVEMHLRSVESQNVRIEALDLSVHFRKGETIWTESSHKFDLNSLPELAHRTGFESLAAWTDREWPFAENLWTAS